MATMQVARNASSGAAAAAAPVGRPFVRRMQHCNLAAPACCAQLPASAAAQRLSPARNSLRSSLQQQRHPCRQQSLAPPRAQPDTLASRDDPGAPPPPTVPASKEEEAAVIAEVEILGVEEPIVEERAENAAAAVAGAIAFGLGVWVIQGDQKGAEYFAGYLLEQALSVDNLFVFILVFNYFKTPVDSQRKVLTYGIATAAVLRLVLIVAGVDIVERFQPVLLLFAAILIFSSAKLLFASDDDDDEEDLSSNKIVAFCKSIMTFSDSYDGDKFFTVQDGVRVATPLLLVLLVVELSDVVFAVDSIPAVFGVTLDPFIVYTSNMFAILSLRGLYTFVSTFMKQLRFLDKAVSIVLGFVGIKIIADYVGFHVPTDASLAIVAGILGTGVATSLLLPLAGDEEADAE